MFAEQLGHLLGIEHPPSFTSRQREMLYRTAFAHYQANLFEKGADIFTVLICYNPYDDRFWKGLASCRQMQKEYEAALHAWAVFCTLAEKKREGFFHASECLRSLGKIADADQALTLSQTL